MPTPAPASAGTCWVRCAAALLPAKLPRGLDALVELAERFVLQVARGDPEDSALSKPTRVCPHPAGNAVTVPVAKWLGERLANPYQVCTMHPCMCDWQTESCCTAHIFPSKTSSAAQSCDGVLVCAVQIPRGGHSGQANVWPADREGSGRACCSHGVSTAQTVVDGVPACCWVPACIAVMCMLPLLTSAFRCCYRCLPPAALPQAQPHAPLELRGNRPAAGCRAV